MLISGYNKQNEWLSDKDYFFSNFGGIWRWASWRRAWQYFDFEMKDLEEFVGMNGFNNLLGEIGRCRQEVMLGVKSAIGVKGKGFDTWDYQWGFARHKNSGLACVPTKSLIENIGYGVGATHTLKAVGNSVFLHEIGFPIRENRMVIPDRQYDKKFVISDKFIVSKLKAVIGRLQSFIGC